MKPSAGGPCVSKWDDLARLTALLAAGLLLMCLSPVLAAPADEDPLWLAYTMGTPEHARELNECVNHLEQVSMTAAKKGPDADWALDPDVQFLLVHRTPAALAIGKALDKGQPDPYLAALVWTAARMGHRELMGKLPGTLARAQSDAGRLAIIRVLACLGTPQAVKSLETYLAGTTEKSPEPLICAACEGLGRTGQPQRLPQIQKAQRLVHSPLGLLRTAAARQECGDTTAQKELLAALSDEKAPPGAAAFVLGFLVDHPVEASSPELADLAVRQQDPELAALALRALTAATGFDRRIEPALTWPPGQEEVKEKADPKNDTGDLRLEDFSQMTQQQRKELTDKILDWWRRHPAALRKAVIRETAPLPC
jgi:hypothetical protein